MPITALPTPPQRTDDPTTFANRADALLSALPTFVTEANTLETDVDSDKVASEAAQTAAETAQTAAETAQTAAETAQTAAETAQTSVAADKAAFDAAYDVFDDRYLGSKSSAPTLDNDGDALQDGAMYFDTTLNYLQVYDVGTTTWVSIPPTTIASLTDVTLTSIATGEILKWDGAGWVNQTLAEAGIAPANNPTFSGNATFVEITETTYNLTGTDIDPANGSVQYKTLSANTTFTESLEDGQSIALRLEGGATYTVTWPSGVWIGSGGNVAPTLNGTKDVIVLWQENSTLYMAYVGYGA
jgi:multidrug efflux pump subunit AcrA (membrane-fusion protein)